MAFSCISLFLHVLYLVVKLVTFNSTQKLKKKIPNFKEIVFCWCYFWNTVCDTCHVTCDTWLVTRDTWRVTGARSEEVNLLSKFQLPSYYGLGVTGDMWHLTCDTRHVTPDMRHLTPNMWHMTCITWHTKWWTWFTNFISLALNSFGVMMFGR